MISKKYIYKTNIFFNMRILLKTSANTTPVPFDYQQKLVGTIHKWIGNNSIHDHCCPV